MWNVYENIERAERKSSYSSSAWVGTNLQAENQRKLYLMLPNGVTALTPYKYCK